MRAYWVLPNREQRNEILASDGEKTRPLRQILDPKLRPAGFSHGVPTELLEKTDPKRFSEILFAERFPGWQGDSQLCFLTTPAGLDSTGRVVHLGLLFILDARERPRFELSVADLSNQDKPYANALLQRMTSATPEDAWAKSARELFDLSSDGGPATNVALERATVPLHSLYSLGPNGLTKRVANPSKTRIAAIIVIIIFAIAGALFSARAKSCSRPDETSSQLVHNGVETWLFN